MKSVKNIILREGFKSVLLDGIKSFTVENLASRLSMSKKTIYQHFPNKECLIRKIIDSRLKKLTNEFNEIINKESDAMIQFIKIREHNIKFVNKINLKRLMYLKTRYPDIWEIIEEYRFNRKTIYSEIFSLAKSQRYLRENLDPKICAALYINIFNSTFQPEFMNDNNLSIDLTITHVKEVVLNGFFNNRGIEKIDEYIIKNQLKS